MKCYDGGELNFHGGRIPEYRGHNVLNWALAAGEKTLWATWHELAESVDSGRIYGESPIDVKPEDTAEICRSNLAYKAVDIFPSAWKKFLKNNHPCVSQILMKGSGRAVAQKMGLSVRIGHGNQLNL